MIDVTAAPYYVRGDGSDCTAGIQAALDAVGSEGMTVVIPAGIYGINGVNPSQPARLEYVGGGLRPKAGTTLVLERGAVLQILPNGSPSYSGIYVGPGQGGVTIRGGGTIRGDRAEHDYTGHVRDADVTHEWGFGVTAHGCKGLAVEGVTVTGCTGDGIYISSLGAVGGTNYGPPERVTVRGCHVHANRRNGIAVIACEVAHLTDNLITDTGAPDASSDGIAPKFGIDLEGYETVLPEYVQHQIPRQVTISGNTFRGNVAGAVVNYNGHDCVIRGNAADGVISYGHSTRTVLSGNVVTGAPIGISGNKARPTGAVITGNVVTGGATGMDLSGRDIVVQGNLVADMTGVGVSVSEAVGVLVQGNQIARVGKRGVNIISGDQVSVLGNRLAQIGREGIADAAAVTGSVVDGNTFEDVGVGALCSGEMALSHNHMRTPREKAFQVQSGARVEISGNTVIGALAYVVSASALLAGSLRVAGNRFRGSGPLALLIVGGPDVGVSIADNEVDLDRATAGTAGVWLRGLTGARVVGNRIGSSGVGLYAAAIRTDESTASVVSANLVGKLPVVTAPTDTAAT